MDKIAERRFEQKIVYVGKMLAINQIIINLFVMIAVSHTMTNFYQGLVYYPTTDFLGYVEFISKVHLTSISFTLGVFMYIRIFLETNNYKKFVWVLLADLILNLIISILSIYTGLAINDYIDEHKKYASLLRNFGRVQYIRPFPLVASIFAIVYFGVLILTGKFTPKKPS